MGRVPVAFGRRPRRRDVLRGRPCSREWSAEDITLLHALATAATSHVQLRTALAVANESAGQLRAELERREVLVRRATMLAQLAQELSSVSTVEQVAQVVTTTGRDVLGAAFANIAVVDADRRHLDIVHSPPLPPEMAEQYGRVVLSDDLPLAHAVTRGETILVPDLDKCQGPLPTHPQTTRSQPVWSRRHRCRCSAPIVRWPARSVSAGARQPSSRRSVRSALTTVAEMCAQALGRSQAR